MVNYLITFDSSRSNDDLSDEVIPRSSLDDDCLAPFFVPDMAGGAVGVQLHQKRT